MSRPTLCRVRTLLLAGCATIALAPGIAAAQSERPINFSIPAQDLGASLNQFARQSDHLIVFSTEAAAGRAAPALQGDLPPERALAMLLEGSGLTFRREGDAFLVVQQGEGGSPQADRGAGTAATVEALIVTAQKKEEAIQDVPIAISAFTQRSLDEQKIEGGFDLLKAVPNVTFSKSNFSGYNFSIRGIGTKAISATTDPGVAVAFNNSTLIVNRLFEQEYFDVERVEVLRGPQGTLYGRNATSGVINVISAKPRLGEFEGDIKLEGGNYNAKRVRGMVNVPIGDTLAIRLAGAMTQRDGYGVNEAAGTPDDFNGVSPDVDGRDLWSTRLTIGWEPMEAIRVNALWERFEEDDNRVRTSKQLCHHDPGRQTVGDFDFGTAGLTQVTTRPVTSQSCLPGSLYDDAAYGVPNGASLPFINGIITSVLLGSLPIIGRGDNALGMGANPYFPFPAFGAYDTNPPCEVYTVLRAWFPIDMCQPDPYGNRTQTKDLRSIHSLVEPIYRAKSDIFELSIDIDLTDSLTFTSQTVYSKDQYFASQDYNRFTTLPIWADSMEACGLGPRPFEAFPGVFIDITGPLCEPEQRGTYANGFYADLTPDGVFTDPQLGPSRSLVAQDLSEVESDQFNQEFRLASNYDADLNFSLGANFTRFETWNDYYVFINALSLLTNFWPFNAHPPGGCYFTQQYPCVYVDPNPLEEIDGEGHNYFRSANPYELTSSAIFGELYWQATETLKVTLGARMSWDRKVFTPIPSQLLLPDYRANVPEGAGPEDCVSRDPCMIRGSGVNGRGSPPSRDIVQEWREPTGRIIVDWKPDLGFTNETMIYGSIAHGYKGGGANPPGIAPPAGIFNALNSGAVAPPTFEPEYIDAFEIGTKNTLLDGGLILNGSAFYYDYEGYQVSKIVDRSAANENFDAKVWGLELEWIFSPTRNLRFNGTVGHLRTEIAEGEQSIDLMDRAAGGNTPFTTPGGVTFDQWMVIKPTVTNASNCIVPVELAALVLEDDPAVWTAGFTNWGLRALCPGGNIVGHRYSGPNQTHSLPGYGFYTPETDAPNGGAGFSVPIGGHELPNAPRWTASFGAQYRFALPWGWDATARVDHYWQDESFARVYNTEYDRLRSWQNTNFSLWFEQPDWRVTAEVYVKNAFDEEPITDAFLNSDDSGLTTNVFTLDPRLIGVSVRKQF